MTPIYLDYNASTPLLPEVISEMRPFLDSLYGNPSSSHSYGTESRNAVELARKRVASLINCTPDEIIFTSGGTESNNLAIKGACYALKNKGNHIITSVVEHPAVTEVCRYLEDSGFKVTAVQVDQYGMADPEEVERAITPETILISIMHSNNEVGTIQPIRQIAAIARRYGILVHTDAAQSVGKVPVDVRDLGVDLLSIAGHKLYAPKGVGSLFIRRGVRLEKIIHGADHEQNLRAGTENVLEIVGLGKAAEMAKVNLGDFGKRTKMLKERLYDKIKKEIPDVLINGHPVNTLPNTLSISFRGIDATKLLSLTPEIAASPGAACHSGHVAASSVIEAMKVPALYAMGTVRFSLGLMTTEEEIDKASEAVVRSVKNTLQNDEKNTTRSIPESGKIRLTDYTHALGCACKIRPQLLEKLLSSLPPVTNPEIIVGPEHSDDAAVIRISEDLALVSTIDVIPPVVDDPYSFGAIAAANALSDIYAMGGKPLFALSFIGFPEKQLPESVLLLIMKGANDKVAEAGIPIVGGHSIEDAEPKFGLAVTGTVHPARVLKNRGAMPGDVLIITKPVGTGLATTAHKRGFATDEEIEEVIALMTALNKPGSEASNGLKVTACTDITGFGLLGHLKEMVKNTSVDAVIRLDKIPMVSRVWDYAAAGMISGGTRNNLDFVKDVARFDDGFNDLARFILADAQTSGGLLISIHPDDAETYLGRLHNEGKPGAWIIGDIQKGDGKIRIMP